MKITGYKLQHRLRDLQQEREVYVNQFNDGLYVFPDDRKPLPSESFEKFRVLENEIAGLQTLQSRYNLTVQVKVGENVVSLMEAIKRVGGAGRQEKMWRSYATNNPNKDRYYTRDTRSADDIVAQRAMPLENIMEEAKRAAEYASQLREAIQIGNATELCEKDLK